MNSDLWSEIKANDIYYAHVAIANNDMERLIRIIGIRIMAKYDMPYYAASILANAMARRYVKLNDADKRLRLWAGFEARRVTR